MRKYLELEEVRYFITIGIVALIGFSVFIVLTKYLGIRSPIASVIGCIFAEIPGFYYKQKWVFKNTNKKRARIQLYIYILYSCIYLLTNAALMHQFSEVANFEEAKSQIFIAFTLYLPNLDMNELIFIVQKT